MDARMYIPFVTRWETVDPIWPLEIAYTYVRGNPTSFRDYTGASAVGLLPILTGPAKCAVYICHKRGFLGHACVDVTGPNGGCSYSSYPDSVQTCGGAHFSPELYACDLVSTDCTYAGNVCACIKSSQNDNYLPWVCWGNARNKLYCGCHALPHGQRERCEGQNCAPAFQYCPPDTGIGGGGGGPGKPCI